MVSHKRSSTGRHQLLPASRDREESGLNPIIPYQAIASWTFGRGTVIRTIWPAVLLHTTFAAGVTSVSITTQFNLGVPPVLITVLGVVIGFVIAYRASSGYDRYWMGRCGWSDLVRTCRTMGRLVWFHVPLKIEKGEGASDDSILKVMREKRLALELIEGFMVALKHHLRGETGIYYEDLYHLVRPLHKHRLNANERQSIPHQDTFTDVSDGEAGASTEDPSPSHRVASPTSTQEQTNHASLSPDPIIPPIDSYGTFNFPGELSVPTKRRGRIERRGSYSGRSSCSERSASQALTRHPYLYPSTFQTTSSPVSTDLIPFSSVWTSFIQLFKGKDDCEEEDLHGNLVKPSRHGVRANYVGRKKRPRIAGGGENLPLEIIRCLSEWVSVLDERDVVSGNPLGGLYGCLTAFEDSLSALERILTTPLPFVYSVQIRQCVWIYLFLLPFQLVNQFGWYTIPGVAVAAFFYIGFLAAGEEIEQPFGYDENDLDLDLFCREIVHADIEALLRTPCPNAYLTSGHEHHPSAHRSNSGIERAADSHLDAHDTVKIRNTVTADLQNVFGSIP